MKPVIVFTTFWDANAIINNDYFIFVERDKLYRCRLFDRKDKPANYQVCSIALSHPDYKALPQIKKLFGEMPRIDGFCPTYNMLQKYKGDKDWDYYTREYRKLLRLRKDFVKEWMDTLKPDTLYFLCCWENTVGESKCHRQLLYDALRKSPSMNDKAFFVYRHGDKEEAIQKWNVFSMSDIPIGTNTSHVHTTFHNSLTANIAAGTPVTLGSTGLAEALGLQVGDAVGTVISSNELGDAVASINSNLLEDFAALLGVSLSNNHPPTTSTSSITLVSNISNNENDDDEDVNDFSLGDDEGDIP